MKCIVWTDVDGNCCVTHPAYSDKRPRPEGETEDEFLAWVVERSLPPGTPYRIMEQADVPTDRVFRGAWEDSGSAVVTNMPKARDIHMAHIRRVRDKELENLDIEWAKATGDTAEQQRLEALRQTLRDIPQNFDLSRFSVPKALKAAWPDELLKPQP